MTATREQSVAESGENKLRGIAARYLPAWNADERQGAISALLEVAGHYDDVIGEVIAQARNKAKLAGLDLMGAELRPPAPASGSVVFATAKAFGDTTAVVPKGAALAAEEENETVYFETEHEVALIEPRLDYALLVTGQRMHDVRANERIKTSDLVYASVAESVLPNSIVCLKLDFRERCYVLECTCQLWTGETWQNLKPEESVPEESVSELELTFRIDEQTESSQATIEDSIGHWLRLSFCCKGKSVQVKTIEVKTTCEATFPVERSFANGLPVDPTAAFAPFGEAPRPGATWTFSCNKVLERSNACISLEFEVVGDATSHPDELPPTKPEDFVTAPEWKEVKSSFANLKDVNLLEPFSIISAANGIAKNLVPLYGITTRSLESFAKAAFDVWPDYAYEAIIKFYTELRKWIGAQMAKIPSHIGNLGPLGAYLIHRFTDSERRKSSDQGISNLEINRLQGPPLDGPKTSDINTETGSDADNSSGDAKVPKPDKLHPRTVLENSNGSSWNEIVQVASEVLSLAELGDRSLSLTVNDIAPMEVYGEQGRWLRLRLNSGGYGLVHDVKGIKVVQYVPPRIARPALRISERSGWRRPTKVLHVRSFHDSNSSSSSASSTVISDSSLLPAWCSISEQNELDDADANYVYLSFDGPLPTGWVSFLLTSDVVDEKTAIPIECELATLKKKRGHDWKRIEEIDDGTTGLSQPGVLRLKLPVTNQPPKLPIAHAVGDRIVAATQITLNNSSSTSVFQLYQRGQRCLLRENDQIEEVEIKSVTKEGWTLSRNLRHEYRGGFLEPARAIVFGLRRSWLRFRVGDNLRVNDARLHTNAARVIQAQTHVDETLGSSNGKPHQTLRTRFAPVMPGEQIEVLELEGKRADLEFPFLAASLADKNDARVVREPMTGRVNEVWVRWRACSSMIGASDEDRCYTVDRSQGVIRFGDARNGRIPPAGAKIFARAYRHGGGDHGNVGTDKIQQFVGVLPNVVGVSNPLPARGGCDGDSLQESQAAIGYDSAGRTESRLARYLRHHSLFRASPPAAVVAADFESLARSTSAEVADAALLPLHEDESWETRNADKQAFAPDPGDRLLCIRLVILPHDAQQRTHHDCKYILSEELSQKIRQRIVPFAPPWMARRLEVIGPTPRQLGIVLTYDGHEPTAELKAKLQAWISDVYFDPVFGGPAGYGWLSSKPQIIRPISILGRIRRLAPQIVECCFESSEHTGDLILKPGEIPLASIVCFDRLQTNGTHEGATS